MPGYAGSSWYFLRYMDPHNDAAFCSRAASDYWGQVDLYIGGTEHAVGHLLYSRMWNKFLFDRGWIGHDEPYKRLVNQGMIQGSSRFVYRLEFKGNATEMGPGRALGSDTPIFVSYGIAAIEGTPEFHQLVNAGRQRYLQRPLHRARVDHPLAAACRRQYRRRGRTGYRSISQMAQRIRARRIHPRRRKIHLRDGDRKNEQTAVQYRQPQRSRQKIWRRHLPHVRNVPRPRRTKQTLGYQGHRRRTPLPPQIMAAVLRRDQRRGMDNGKPTEQEWKCIYRTIKKVEEATERFSFNTGVSALMIGVNELTDLKCHKRDVLEKLDRDPGPLCPACGRRAVS